MTLCIDFFPYKYLFPEKFTPKTFGTQTLLQTATFWHRSFSLQTVLNTETFTHKIFDV